MNTMPVYAFFDAQGVRHYVDSDDFAFTGTWSASGTYFASPYEATMYGSMLYMCITDNIGRVPTRQPTRYQPTRYWSPMVIVVGAGTTPANAALDRANEAYDLAVIGTNLGSLAYELAATGSNLAWESYLLAQTGTAIASTALDVANGAFAIAVAGTSGVQQVLEIAAQGTQIGSMAYDRASDAFQVAGDAYALAVAGTNAGAAGNMAYEIAGQAYTLAVAGTNAGSNALNVAGEAYALAASGTLLAGAAASVAQGAFDLALGAFAIAVAGTSGVGQVLQIVEAGTNLAQTAYDIAVAGTNELVYVWEEFANDEYAQIVTNGSFSSNTASWTPLGAAVATRVAGGPDGSYCLRVAGTGNADLVTQALPTKIGEVYNLTFYTKVDGGADIAEVSLGLTPGGTEKGFWFYTNTAWEPHFIQFTASSTTTYLNLGIGNLAGNTYFDMVSILTEQPFYFQELVAKDSDLVATHALATSGTAVATQAYVLAQSGTAAGYAANAAAGQAYALAQIGTSSVALATQAWNLAVAGTNAGAAGTMAYGIAGEAYALAVAGTNAGAAGAMAFDIAGEAYAIAVAGTSGVQQVLEIVTAGTGLAQAAFDIAVAGTNAAAAASNLAFAAYGIAQIGTNTGTAAYNLASTGSNLAYTAWLLAQAGTTTSFANPSAEVTLSYVNGAASTAMRSDSAPRLSQAIAPTWTGYHSFTKGLAVPTLASVNLTTPVTYLMTDSRGAITISSTGSVAADRQFALGAGNGEGHYMTLVWSGTGLGELLNNAEYSGCRVRLQSDYWRPEQYSTMLLRFDGVDWLEMSRTPAVYSDGGTLAGNLVVPNVSVGVGSYSYWNSEFYSSVGTRTFSFAGPAYQRVTVNGAFDVRTQGHKAGAEIAVVLVPDGIVHTLAYNGSTVTWFGTTPPVEIYNKTIVLALTCVDDSPPTIYGAVAVQV